ncbi:MAG: GTP 3',8-cyclase MoaA, partial [Methanoregulaceae archaeon]|nr:GTP 3',8-cyclase MoaA [Methanoregulaceae archaeon]
MLRDPFDRPVSNIRVSLTPTCNLRCIYCHAEGEKNAGAQIGVGDIAAVLEVAKGIGIRSVKFTGGEPTLREDLPEIISSVPCGMESSMTTNGTLLADIARDLRSAGLSRVNVSLDSLDPANYQKITGCDRLGDVLSGIEAALDAGLTPIKLNMVVLEGINDQEIPSFLEYVRGNRDLVLQLIELMEFRDCHHHSDLTGVEERLA